MTTVRKTDLAAAVQPGAHNIFQTTMAKPNLKPVQTTYAKPVPASSQHLDPDDLVLCSDDIPAHRKRVANKYDEKFAALPMGGGFEVHPDHVMKVANSLRKWIETKALDAHVRSIRVHPDCKRGYGRVWMKPGPQSSPTVRNAKAKKA